MKSKTIVVWKLGSIIDREKRFFRSKPEPPFIWPKYIFQQISILTSSLKASWLMILSRCIFWHPPARNAMRTGRLVMHCELSFSCLRMLFFGNARWSCNVRHILVPQSERQITTPPLPHTALHYCSLFVPPRRCSEPICVLWVIGAKYTVSLSELAAWNGPLLFLKVKLGLWVSVSKIVKVT